MIVLGAQYYVRLIPGRANYVVAVDGQFELDYGTSASTPVVGSMIAMINDARLAVGKGPVGEFPGLSTKANALILTRRLNQSLNLLLYVCASIQ